MRSVRFLSPAKQEMRDAAFYYENRKQGLGKEFIDRIDLALKEIRVNPELWPLLGKGIRRRLLNRFPYALLYRVDSDEIVVMAITHTHRKPDYWIERT